jgi:hypothetical protein
VRKSLSLIPAREWIASRKYFSVVPFVGVFVFVSMPGSGAVAGHVDEHDHGKPP